MGSIEYRRSVEAEAEVDLAVVGAGPAGVTAALAASRLGASVCLLEQGAMLGGLGTSGLVSVFLSVTDGRNVLVGGIGREIMETLRKRGGTGPEDGPDNWRLVPFNAEVLKSVYDGLVRESSVGLRLYSRLVDVVVHGGRIEALVVSQPEGLRAIRARLTVDATGDAGVASAAGVPCVAGDEAGQTQAPTLCAYYADVDWARYRRFLEQSGQGGDLQRTLVQAHADGALRVLDLHHPGAFRIAESHAFVNAGHVYGADCLSAKGLTAAMLEARELVVEYWRFYRRYVPGFECASLVATGSVLGVRETRRVVGEYVLSVDDFRARRSFPDEIGRFNYPVDVHRSSASAEDYERFRREFDADLRYGVGESYGIPYRCLLPRGIDNLLVAGRCLSADRGMQGSTRVMPCCYIQGQAAGTAAALCLARREEPKALDPDLLRRTLREQGAYLP